MNDGTANSNPTNDDLIVVLPFGTKLPLTRRSIQTGEFWFFAALVAALIWLEAIDKVPPTLATAAQVVLAILVGWLRTHAKAVGGEQVMDAIEAAKTLPPAVVMESVMRHTAELGAEFEVAKAEAEKGKAGGPSTSLRVTALVAGLALLVSSCGTVVKEQGKTVFYTPANVGHLEFQRTARSTRLVMDQVDHAVVHKAVGSAVANGAAGTGAAVATSGLLGIFH